MIGWLLIVLLFAIGLVGAVYPALPGVVAIYAAFLVYGWFFSFEPFHFWFWFIQSVILIAVFIGDYAVSAWGVDKFGGSRASIIGSTIGILIGPFVIPAFGLLIGPFLGAFIAELLIGSNVQKSFKVGIGSLVGLLSSMVVKIILQLLMIILFILWLLL